MEPVLISYHAPVHDLEQVARQVVREGLPSHLRAWQRSSGSREWIYPATCQRLRTRLGLAEGQVGVATAAREAEAKSLATSMAGPDEDQRESFKEILTRGRTLACRALVQTQPKPNPNEEAVQP